MKKKFQHHRRSLLVSLLMVVLTGHSQQQFTVTSSRLNNYCNGTCTLFDVEGLNSNPTAILFINTVEVKGINLDPHPICAYYNGKQWSVMNVDNATIPIGAQFNVQYYATPDENHFLHIVTKENLVKSNSYIDQSALNGNPKAVVQLFQSASPNIRGGYVNKEDVKIEYDDAAGKWFIANKNGKPLDYATGYNISFSSGKAANSNAITVTQPVNNLTTTTPFVPGPKADNTGQRVFMTAVGKAQGLFPGENMTTRIEITSFEMEMNSPRDLATGQTNGKRQHFPINFQKATGTASPQFFKAFTTNEQFATITFEVYKPSAAGTNVLDYKIVVTNASVSWFKQSYTEGQKGFMDFIKITFQTIEFNNGTTGVTETWPSLN